MSDKTVLLAVPAMLLHILPCVGLELGRAAAEKVLAEPCSSV